MFQVNVDLRTLFYIMHQLLYDEIQFEFHDTFFILSL
jgi:hypothetical protein